MFSGKAVLPFPTARSLGDELLHTEHPMYGPRPLPLPRFAQRPARHPVQGQGGLEKVTV